MSRQALQVYLTPDQHRALKEEARRSGRSMTEVVRRLIETHLRGGAPPTDFSNLVGAVRTGEPTDIAAHKDEMIGEAIGALHRH